MSADIRRLEYAQWEPPLGELRRISTPAAVFHGPKGKLSTGNRYFWQLSVNTPIYYDADDLRVLRAFQPDGTEFGELQAGGLWSATPHSLDVRKRIFRAKRLRQLRFAQFQDPVQVYLQYKRLQSKRSRRAASEIAQIKDGIQQRSEPMPSTKHVESLPLAVGPVKARRLRIPPGFA